MKISGHKYDNDVFNSLLDGMKGDVIVKTAAKKPQQANVGGMDIFSSKTSADFTNIQEDELRVVAAELQFCADNAKVAVTADDLSKFAQQVKQKGLRGKSLERAAQRYCSDLGREIASPQGTTRTSNSLLNQLDSHAVVPASYPTDQFNETKPCGYMGMSKNPNTIWDSEALHRMASVPEKLTDRNGDEQIKASKKANTEFRQNEKDSAWKELQDKLSDSSMIRNKIANASTGQEVGTTQKLPVNSMSIFSNDRDFDGIPEKTAGESLKGSAKERAEKSANSKEEWNKVSGSKKSDNSASALFDSQTSEISAKPSAHRSATDKLFDGLAQQYQK